MATLHWTSLSLAAALATAACAEPDASNAEQDEDGVRPQEDSGTAGAATDTGLGQDDNVSTTAAAECGRRSGLLWMSESRTASNRSGISGLTLRGDGNSA